MAKARKPKKGGRPAQRAEPTTHQLRQEYYQRRADEQALEDLGIGIDPDRPPPLGDASLWARARDELDRLEIVHAAWRWLGLTGSVPEPEDWDTEKGWPSPSEVEAVFESWDGMLAAARLEESVVGELVEQVLRANDVLTERREEQDALARRLEEEAKRVPEIKRQADVAKAKREEADARAMEAEGALGAVERERDAALTRVTELEAALADARSDVAAAADAPPAETELLEEMERTLSAHASTSAERDALHELAERLRAERDQDRRAIAELTRTLALLDAAGGEEADGAVAGPAADEEPPATVLEAVERAAAEAKHLRFAPRAFESADDSPFRRPGLVLRTLRGLDDLAGRYIDGDMGRSLTQAAADHGITQWKGDVSETTRKRYEDEYTFMLDGRRLWVGPHIGLGSGSGAGFVARIYLHVSDGGDGLERGITVAVVGRHLPDTTT